LRFFWARRLGGAVVLAMMLLSGTALALAMHFYPGGTELNRHSVGHSFWFNLMCDLTGDRALNGAVNAGRGYARAAMAAFSVGLAAFWLILPAEFPERRTLARVVRVGGALSVTGILLAPVIPGGLSHAVVVFLAAVPGVVSAGAGVVATLRYVKHKVIVTAAVGSLAAATIDSLLYAHRVLNDFHTVPPAMPVFQRLTMLFVFAWAGATALRAVNAPAARPSVQSA
jgi:hypothetical protein